MMTKVTFSVALVVGALAAMAGTATASDRPFLATTSAAAEEDDDNVWALQGWFDRAGRGASALHSVAEYSFNPTTSVQLEWSRSRVRGEATSQDLEFEFKHLFNHIARDGWGWGINTSLVLERSESKWQRGGWAVTLPFSLKAGDDTTLHANVGVAKPREARREWTSALALEHMLARRFTLFAELAREGESTLAQAGVRHWIKKDKVSIDFAMTQRRADGVQRSGWVIGLAFNDL